MKIEHSPDVDALYVYLREVEVYRSVEPTDGIIVDFDEAGVVVGVEILDASQRIGPSDVALLSADGGPDYTRDQCDKIRSILSAYAHVLPLVEEGS